MPKSPRDAQQLVEDQIHRWEVELKERAGEPPQEPWPPITVSREFGSLGAEAARIAAERLGFSFWDQEIVHAIAEQTGAQRALLESLDEKSRSRIEDFIAESLVGAVGSASEYVRHVARVVRSIQKHGAAVIIGRGSQFIVTPSHALRVRVVCPEAKRIEGYAERQQIDDKAAERTVAQGEKERLAFHRRYYGRDVSDPNHYDLVVSTGELTPVATADVIIATYRAKFERLPARIS